MSLIDDVLQRVMVDKRFTAVAFEVLPKMCTASAYGNPEFPRELDVRFIFRTTQTSEDRYQFGEEGAE